MKTLHGCAQRDWSQGDLADALEVSRQSVSKWETDSSVPELEKLVKLASLFGVTLDALVRGEAPQQDEQSSAPQAAPADFAPRQPLAVPRRHTTAGLVMFCTGAALFLLTLLLTGSAAGIIFAIPFLTCSVICFVSSGRRTALWCAWALYVCADLYLRYATGLSWATVLQTFRWTPEMNYARLIVAWGQFLAMLGTTLVSYRRLRLAVTKKRLLWLALGYVVALVLLPLAMSLCGQVFLPPQSGYRYSLCYILSICYSYLRLPLITVLSVRTLAVWRTWHDKKRARE